MVFDMSSSFDDSWGVSRIHELKTRLSEQSEIALQELQTKPMNKLSGWLADVIAKAPAQAREACVDTWLPQRYALIEQAARVWIDCLFAELLKPVREFNNSSAAEHLTIVVESPKPTFQLPCKRDPSFDPYKFTCYQGHLATYNWALLIRTYYESMQIFVVPSEMLLGLENDCLSRDVRPLAEWHPAVEGQQVRWSLSGVALDDATTQALARELFTDFISLALGIANVSDLFTPAAHQSQQSQVQCTSQQERLSAFIRDLHMWRAHDLFAKALTRDVGALAKLTLEPEASPELRLQIELLGLQYAEVQSCWSSLVATMVSLDAQCKEHQAS
jgi:hypothetical protein